MDKNVTVEEHMRGYMYEIVDNIVTLKFAKLGSIISIVSLLRVLPISDQFLVIVIQSISRKRQQKRSFLLLISKEQTNGNVENTCELLLIF